MFDLRPTLSYGHELWVRAKRMRSQIQLSKMNFLCRVAGITLKVGVRSSDIQEVIKLELKGIS